MKQNRVLLFALFLALILDAAIVQSQQLTVQIEAGKQVVLARADVEALPYVKVTTSASGDLQHLRGSRLRLYWEKPELPLGRL